MSFLIDIATRGRRNDSAYREALAMLQGMSARSCRYRHQAGGFRPHCARDVTPLIFCVVRQAHHEGSGLIAGSEVLQRW